jgi:nucleotide-binding universal stress UspA family protein
MAIIDNPVSASPVSVALDKILFSTDFSESAEKAAAYAKALAQRFGSAVEVVHIFDPSVVICPEDATLGYTAQMKEELSAECVERVRDDFTSSGIKSIAISHEGHSPAHDLIEIAKKDKVDLIVTGTASHTDLGRMILGSTAESLIRNAPCPVLTVGPNAAIPEDKPLFFQKIIYATDFSPEAARAAVFALSFAQDSGAKLLLCYVNSINRSSLNVQKVIDASFREALSRLVPESSYDWCNPEFIVEHGEAASAILGLAERVKADLIVLGARKSSFWLTHFERGVTPDLLAQARCPVMTIC